MAAETLMFTLLQAKVSVTGMRWFAAKLRNLCTTPPTGTKTHSRNDTSSPAPPSSWMGAAPTVHIPKYLHDVHNCLLIILPVHALHPGAGHPCLLLKVLARHGEIAFIGQCHQVLQPADTKGLSSFAMEHAQ